MKRVVSLLVAFTMIFQLMVPSIAADATFRVTVSKSSGGIVEGAGKYFEGEEVVVNAEAKSGYEFSGWTNIKGIDTYDEDDNELSFTMPANKVSMKALFTKIPTYKVTVSKSSGGTVTGAGSYKDGNEVTIIAEAKSGYEFSGWTNIKGTEISNVKNSILTFKMPKEKVSMKANFVKDSSELKVSKSSGGTVEGAGNYKRDEEVTLKAIPNAGYVFTGWTSIKGIEVTDVSLDTITFKMPLGKVSLKANFKKTPTYKITISKSSGGTVIGSGSYQEGNDVILTAVAKDGYAFSGWTNVKGIEIADTTLETITFKMPKEKVSIKANFIKTANKVKLSKSSGGNVTGAGTYNKDTEVKIAAIANSGYVFTGWTNIKGVEIADTSLEELTFIMPLAEVSMKANFKKIIYGDVNSNGKVNNDDLELLKQYIQNNEIQISNKAADVNNDGNVSKVDEVILGRFLSRAAGYTKLPYTKNVIVYGDVNGDYVVDLTDVEEINNFVDGLTQFTEQQKTNADVDLDGNITENDANLVLGYYIKCELNGENNDFSFGYGDFGYGYSIKFEIEGLPHRCTYSKSYIENGEINHIKTIKCRCGRIEYSINEEHNYTNGKCVCGEKEITEITEIKEIGIQINGIWYYANKNNPIVSVPKCMTLYVGEQYTLITKVNGIETSKGLKFTSTSSAVEVEQTGKINVVSGHTLCSMYIETENGLRLGIVCDVTSDCEHKGIEWIINENTHSSKCNDCNCVLEINVKHEYVNGVCECGAKEALEMLYGDVNGDREIDLQDSILISNYIAGSQSEINETIADVYADRKINIMDVLTLVTYISGEGIELPHQCEGYVIKYENLGENHQEIYKCKCGMVEGNVTVEHEYVDGICVCGVKDILYGDANNDGEINGKDLTVIRRYIYNYGETTEINKEKSNVFFDENIDNMDVILLRNYIVGIVNELPHVCEGYVIEYENLGENHQETYKCKCGVLDGTVIVEHAYVAEVCECGAKDVVNDTRIFGDLNDDLIINSMDAELLLAHLYGSKLLDESYIEFADLNSDGNVDKFDMYFLNCKIDGTISELPHTCTTYEAKYSSISTTQHEIQYTCGCGVYMGSETLAHQFVNNKCVCGAYNVVYGDVNQDNIVNDLDLARLNQHINGTSLITDEVALRCGDLNIDGKIDKFDMYFLTGKINGTITEIPHQCRSYTAYIPAENLHELRYICECGVYLGSEIAEHTFVDGKCRCGAYETLYGDVDNNREVNKFDATLIYAYVGGSHVEINTENADVNLDGVVDDLDKTIIFRHVIGRSGYEKLPYTGKVDKVEEPYYIEMVLERPQILDNNDYYTLKTDWDEYKVYIKDGSMPALIPGEVILVRAENKIIEYYGSEVRGRRAIEPVQNGNPSTGYMLHESYSENIPLVGNYQIKDFEGENYPKLIKDGVEYEFSSDTLFFNTATNEIFAGIDWEEVFGVRSIDVNNRPVFNEKDLAIYSDWGGGRNWISYCIINFPIIYGDVNVDGVVNLSDLQTMTEHVNGSNAITNVFALRCGDLNRDGNIDKFDVYFLNAKLNGTITELPHRCSTYKMQYNDLKDKNFHEIQYTCGCGVYMGTEEVAHVFTNGKCVCGSYELVYGDINNDGVVNTTDADLLERSLTGNTVADNDTIKRADVNFDGKIDEIDLKLIQYYCDKVITRLPYEGNLALIKLKMESYNPTQVTTIKFVKDGQEYTYTTNAQASSGKIVNTFELFTSDIGTYEITLTKPGHLTYTIKNVEIVNGINDLTDKIGVMKMIAGDVNGDGYVTEEDVRIAEIGTNMKADVNGDGKVDEIDLDIIQNYLDETTVDIEFTELEKEYYNDIIWKNNYVAPLKSLMISSPYGKRVINNEIEIHYGIDFVATTGTAIYSIEDGIVVSADNVGTDTSYGKYVVVEYINNTGSKFYGIYAQQDELDVISGQKVKKGQRIGFVGSTGRSTGPHLHFEIRTSWPSLQSDASVNPSEYLINN